MEANYTVYNGKELGMVREISARKPFILRGADHAMKKDKFLLSLINARSLVRKLFLVSSNLTL